VDGIATNSNRGAGRAGVRGFQELSLARYGVIAHDRELTRALAELIEWGSGQLGKVHRQEFPPDRSSPFGRVPMPIGLLALLVGMAGSFEAEPGRLDDSQVFTAIRGRDRSVW
jgi:hypothetical protein